MSDPPKADHTPLRYTLTGNYRFRRALLPNPAIAKELGIDMHGRFIGPFPPRTMMCDTMKIDDARYREFKEIRKQIAFRIPKKDPDSPITGERTLYESFAKQVVKNGISPDMDFFISADQKRKVTDLRPDVGLKDKMVEVKAFFEVPSAHRHQTRSQTARARQQDLTQPQTRAAPSRPVIAERKFDWGTDTLVVEFKYTSGDDPFHTKKTILEENRRNPSADKCQWPSFEKKGDGHRKIRGQLAAYAREMFNYQQRTHLFQLLVTGRHARIIFWDHSGAIVSERIDYVKNPQILGEFFWRHNYMTPKARGLDPTAVLADEKERELFTTAITTFVENMNNPDHPQRVLPDAKLTTDSTFPIFKITVRDSGSTPLEIESGPSDKKGKAKETHPGEIQLLVQRPMFNVAAPVGRATRGYVAIEVTCTQERTEATQQQEPLFLKDTWRIDHPLLKVERVIYNLLEKYNVKRVPTLICGGDVGDQDGVQKTVVKDWVDRQELRIQYARIRVHFHHRLVQRLAYPIESAKDSKEMATAFYDVLGAIEASYNGKTKLVHRDISAGNVMIGEERLNDGEVEVGLLGDWDHANEMVHEDGYECQDSRSGTWAFMSIAMLQDPLKAHEILDDLESVFWTFFYSSVHRFEHTGFPDMDMFDEANNPSDARGATSKPTGGSKKKALIWEFSSFVKFACKPLNSLMVSLSEQLFYYYSARAACVRAESAVERSATEDNNAKLKAANEHYKAIHKTLSKPSTWRALFKAELNSQGWVPGDTSTTRLHPERTPEEELGLFEYKTESKFQSNTRITGDSDSLPVPVANNTELASNIDDGEEGEEGYTSDEEDGEDAVDDGDKSDSATLPEQSAYSSSSESDGSPSPTPLPGPSNKRTREEFENFVAGSSSRATSKRSKSEVGYVASAPSMILEPVGTATVKTRSGRRVIAPKRYQSGDVESTGGSRRVVPSRRYKTSGDMRL